jgi:hypothetical protein
MRRSLASGSRDRASHASRARAGRSRERQSKWAGSTGIVHQNGAGNGVVSAHSRGISGRTVEKIAAVTNVPAGFPFGCLILTISG